MRAQRKDTDDVLEVIPKEKFEGELPAILVEHHAHWLDLSTSIIEIRPLDKPWEQSPENWYIHSVSGQYRLFRGRETLVDIRSPTWAMVSRRLECLDTSGNLIITTSPIEAAQPSPSPSPHLSVALPRYGLSFFVNRHGELESCNFKDMVYDENQCIGTLFGLVNRLVLRPKAQIEEGLIPRSILIPIGGPCVEEDTHHVRVTIHVEPSTRSPVTVTRSPITVTCYTYKVDSELGCLTGIVNLKSRLYLASLHAMTSSVCRPDPLTGRSGLEEAIFLVWSAGIRLAPQEDTEFQIPSWELRSPQLHFAATRIRGDRTASNKNLSSPYTLLQETYLFPSEVVPPPSNEESKLKPRNHGPSKDEDIAYTIASAIQLWFLDAPINDTFDWVEVWAEMLIQLGEPPSLDSDSDPSLWGNLSWIKQNIYDILRRSEGGTQCFQLQFFLPTIEYLLEESALIALLTAFSRQLHIPGIYPCWNEYAPSDGYCPYRWLIYGSIKKAFRSGREGLAFEIDVKNAAVDKLLESWQSGTVPVPTDLLNPDLYDVESLTANLQDLFASWNRNSRLKEYFTRGPNEPRPSPFLNPPQTPEEPMDWQITLGRLLRERAAPQLPACHKLPRHRPDTLARNNVSTSSDITRLAQLFSSLKMNDASPTFQRQYVADLDVSASHFRIEESHSCITSGSTREPAVETLRNHYRQCRDDYKMGLEILKEALGPRTDIEQALDEYGHWPRVTPYTLLRCLATSSQINPSESWKECLVSLALLALEPQRARRLLRLALDNTQEEFLKELDNEGCDGWAAAEHPDWLLMQVHLLYFDVIHMFAKASIFFFVHLSCKETSSSVAYRQLSPVR